MRSTSIGARGARGGEAPSGRRHVQADNLRRRYGGRPCSECARHPSAPEELGAAGPRAGEDMSKLTLDDIADLRAYEREREEFRSHVIALKQRRRIPVGPFVSFVF